jgi:hypothetical protein
LAGPALAASTKLPSRGGLSDCRSKLSGPGQTGEKNVSPETSGRIAKELALVTPRSIDKSRDPPKMPPQ